MKLAILGCGNWGSVFAMIQHAKGHNIRIWEYDQERAVKVKKTRDNGPFLKGYRIPDNIDIHWDISKATCGADIIVIAIPCQTLSDVFSKLTHTGVTCSSVLNLVKGIDVETLQLPHEIIKSSGNSRTAVFSLSGPCIANEIIRGAPTAAVIVGDHIDDVSQLQQELSTDTFRLYLGDDIFGVELGAALKNVIALGCGISDGLGYGTNAKGALITRGIVEIQRLGAKMGAHSKTFWGLSGLGDLVTTSFSTDSRNYNFGRHLGEGQTMEEIQQEMVMVAEGVSTSLAVEKLRQRHDIEMPICESVYSILYRNKSPQQAIQELMMRPLTHE